MRGYAHTSRFKIVREFVDVETAKRARRTGFGEMLAFLKRSPSCRTIVVEKTDRLYRNLKDYVTLDEFDLEIHFVKENFILSRESRSTEKFMHGIKVLMAKNYVDYLGEEVRKGLSEKADQGIPPYKVGLGYRNVEGVDGRRTIEPDPDTGRAVRRMFENYSTGEYSLADLAEIGKREGLFLGGEADRVRSCAYEDKLDGRITATFFDQKAEVWRAEQQRIKRTIQDHEQANHTYLEEGLALLELAD